MKIDRRAFLSGTIGLFVSRKAPCSLSIKVVIENRQQFLSQLTKQQQILDAFNANIYLDGLHARGVQ